MVFYGFQRSREAFFRRVTSLWEAIIGNPRFCLCLAFGCFGTGPKHCFLWVPKRSREAFFRRVFCFLLAFGCCGTGPKHCFLWVPKVTWGILSACFLLGMGSTHAGVRLFRNRSFVFYGFQRWREAFCLRVFCLAWARILLVLRSFRIWRWRDFEQPSFGIHVSNGFLLGRGSTAAGVRVFRNRSFVFYRFQRWREAFCLRVFCLAWARILLVFWSFRIWCWRDFEQRIHGVRVFRNRSKALFFSFFYFIFLADYRFQRWREAFCQRVFCLAWARILLAFGCCGTGPKHCFLWARILLAFGCCGAGPKHCFLWVPKVTWGILSACFLLGMGSTHAGVRLFRNRSFVFYGFQRWREAFCLRVFCLAWARILLVFRSFRIWRWRDCEQPSFGIHVSNGFLLGRGSTAAGDRVFRNRSFVFSYGFQRWREAFCLRVFCLAWARILLVFRSFRIWRWRDFEQPSFGIHVPACGYYVRFERFFAWQRLDCCWRSGVSEPKLCFFLWVPKVTWSILSACFLLGMGSNLAGVSVFSNLTLTRLWVAIVRNPRFERFFAWQRLDCCWRSGVSEPKLCFLWVPKVTWSILSACFLLGMGSNLAGVSVFSNLTLTRLWAAIVRNPRSCLWLYVRFERASSAPFLVYESCSWGLDPAGVSVFSMRHEFRGRRHGR